MQQENSLVQRSFGDEPCTEERTYYGELSMYGAAPLSPTGRPRICGRRC